MKNKRLSDNEILIFALLMLAIFASFGVLIYVTLSFFVEK